MLPFRYQFFFKKTRLLGLSGATFVALYMGVFTHIFEKDFYTEFTHPLEEDISVFVSELREGRKLSREPINQYNYTFINSCKYKCMNKEGPLHIVYIIKSALAHFQNRLAIRNSWGFERRFSNVPIRTVFVLGVDHNNLALQERIDMESKQFGDILQANFTDTYYNNTIKTMMAFKWAVKYCNNSKFYFFADDDHYVSTRNLLLFIRNPVQYPAYLETSINSVDNLPSRKTSHRNTFEKDGDSLLGKDKQNLLQVTDFELQEKAKLFSGYVFVSSPHRHHSSKWYIPLSEYPYNLYPPYVTAGAYVVSKEVLLDIYYGSFFTEHFRFDDVFIGIVAYKLKIKPFHCDKFYFYKKRYYAQKYYSVIASHGYSDPVELLRVWREQKLLGNV